VASGDTATPEGRLTVHVLLARARSRLERLDPRQAFEAVRQGAFLVDTRSAEHRSQQGVIPGAHIVHRNVLLWRLDPASGHQDPSVGGLERKIIVIFAEGYSSSLDAARLQEIGFTDATDVIGGFEARKQAGLPVQPGSPISNTART
jgi:rhodanese-related sulfurtransferase